MVFQSGTGGFTLVSDFTLTTMVKEGTKDKSEGLYLGIKQEPVAIVLDENREHGTGGNYFTRVASCNIARV